MAKDAAAIGQSAVVTLTFPVGARPTAMGEAFTGLANDANAIFYNPAGLGQSPLTLSWKTHMGDSAFTAVAARSAAAFGSRDYVWGGSHAGVMRFNGKIWEKGEVYLVEGDESLRAVAQRYFNSDDKATIDNALWEIRRENNLGMKRYDDLVALLTPQAAAFKGGAAPFNPKDYARMLILLTPDESVGSHIAAKVLPQSMSEQARKALADKIIDILGSEDRGISNVIELTIPYTVAVRDTVTAMALDASERLWVGTVSGLWRYHNGKWQRFTEDDGFPSNRVTSIAVSPNGDVAIGTEAGLALMKDSEWSVLTSENGLPDSYITSLAFVASEQLYVGTPKGLARKSGGNVAAFDTSSGLLSLGVAALFADSKGRLWIGGDNGITIYSPSARTWTRYKFPGSTVYSFAEQSNGAIWIGTNKGVITHKAGKTVVGGDGKAVTVPEWKTYHTKNALKNDNIRSIAACGKDMWIATDGAMHQYAHAETQVLLFYEQLLPAFGMSDLWHGFPAVVIPTEDWGTLAFSMNFINMGDNEQWDELENYLGKARSWEGVFGISYGFPIKEDLSLGLNAKYVYSVLDSRSGGIGQTFAIDAGILKKNFLIDKFDIGFMLQNMGPKIYYLTPEEADPIPFSLRLGLAYKPVQTPFHELTLVLDAYREVVKNYYDKGPDPFWVALWTGMLANNETAFKEEIQEIN
ncbi:MAG: PorV/PorQ family protein, partial [Chitinispirillales bacterium]|nr:PorV/PorQ family protein [Chitinispirillales bacterium]